MSSDRPADYSYADNLLAIRATYRKLVSYHRSVVPVVLLNIGVGFF